MKKGIFLSKLICVTELIDHIYNETKRIMHGTDYEDNLFFYHDELTKMTNKDAVNYMKSKDIYKHWILPKLDVNVNTKWANSPTGNSPEFNPLDCNLFKDLHDAVKLNLLLIHRGRTDIESKPELHMNGSKNL